MQIRRTTGFLVLSLMTAFFLAACGGGGDGGGSPTPDLSPGIIQVSAANVTNNSAVLQALVNPKGSPTTAWFVYGKDPNLSGIITTTLPQNLGSGSSNITVTQAISGLEVGKSYSYRIVVHNDAGGTKEGTIFTFNTLPLPVVQTGNVTSITTSGADLHAIVNPNGVPTFAWFEYGKTSDLGTVLDNQSRGSGTDNVNIISTLPGLDFATTYYYRIVAQNQNGIAPGSSLNFTTAGGVPAVVTNSNPTVTTTSAILSGQVNPNGLPTFAWFEYGETSSFGSIWDNQSRGSGTAPVTVTAPELPGLKEATLYYYRIAAKNGAGATRYGDPLTFKTAGAVPDVVTNPNPTVTSSSAILSGQVNPNGLPTFAWFEYGETPSMGSIWDNQSRGSGTSLVTVTSPSLTGLKEHTQYSYRIAAKNGAGPTRYGATLPFTTLFNPGPTAIAHFNETVWIGDSSGPKGYLGSTVVTLDGAESYDGPTPTGTPYGTITSYEWTQISGSNTVTIFDPTADTTTFVSPAVTYGTSDNMVFQLKVTDNRGLSGTDNIWKNVKWGFLDEFNTNNTTLTYNVFKTTNATFTHDSVEKRARVETGNGESLVFTKEFKILPEDIQLYGNTGVFSLDFNPTAQFGSGGNIKVRLLDTPDTYYELSTNPASVKKVRTGGPVDSAPFPLPYSQGPTYQMKITFSGAKTTFEAFGNKVELTANDFAINVVYFEVETNQQNAYFDNIKLEAAP